ncbi:MAG: hypothetical protein ACE37K_07430 [Planctomycetota bacterium]
MTPPPPLPTSASWRWTAAAALPALLLFALQAGWPWPFFSDDSFISLRYSERLLHGDGLTWTDGEAVEGYSNLLWVVLTAALGALGLELVTAARVLGALCTVLALWSLAAALRPRDLRTAAVASLAPLLVAATQPVMIWSLAGLEGPLLLALLAWGFGGLLRRFGDRDARDRLRTGALLAAGVPFALACWTRPDGPLWALGAGVGIGVLALQRGVVAAIGRAFWFGLPAVLAVLAQLAFRLAYYGDYVPNTAHVKAELDPASIGPGLRFVGDALLAMPALSGAAATGAALALLLPRTRAFVVTLLLPVLAWLAYLAAIGGDHFPGLRLLHGVIAPMALLAALGVHALPWPTVRAVVAIALAVGGAWLDASVARSDPRSRQARGEIWEWHGKALGEALGRAFAERQPRIAVDAAGALPYYSGLPALDMLGLCDRTIATTPFPAWIETMRKEIPRPPGHMRGNGAYVMDRQPDLMVFQHAPGLPLPVFVSACEFEADPRFLEHYRLFLLDLHEPEILPGLRQPHLASIWVRVDGRAGIRRTPDAVTVPAYLFGSYRLGGPAIRKHQPPTGDPAADRAALANLGRTAQFLTARSPFAEPGDDGALQLVLAPRQVVTFALELPAGSWLARSMPEHGGATADFEGAERITLAESGPATVTLRAGDASARPQRVVLQRLPD